MPYDVICPPQNIQMNDIISPPQYYITKENEDRSVDIVAEELGVVNTVVEGSSVNYIDSIMRFVCGVVILVFILMLLISFYIYVMNH